MASLATQRVELECELREFSRENRGLFESNSRQGVLTGVCASSKPKPRSLIETQVRTLSAGIMADIGRKNRLFELTSWRWASSITIVAIICCVIKLMKNAKIIMSQSHLF